MRVQMVVCLSVTECQPVQGVWSYGSWDKLQTPHDPDKDEQKRMMHGWMGTRCKVKQF